METIDVQAFSALMLSVCDRLLENQQLLCQLDSHVGDGDHGLTVARGFGAVRQWLPLQQNTTFPLLLEGMGELLMEEMGGAIGPILGSFFTGMAIEGPERLSTKELAAMVESGLDSVMLIGGAAPGDRTLVDALSPASLSLNLSARQGLPLPQALGAAAAAARQGAESTAGMVAKRGRARFLQEGSRGYQDAGATTIALMFEALADGAEE